MGKKKSVDSGIKQCEFKGCSTHFYGDPKKKYCERHERAHQNELRRNRNVQAPQPTEAKTDPPADTVMNEEGVCSTSAAPSGRVVRGHRALIERVRLEKLRKKFAKKAFQNTDPQENGGGE